jgi:hypothetical protein
MLGCYVGVELVYPVYTTAQSEPPSRSKYPRCFEICVQKPGAGIFKQSMGARNRVGIGLSYRTARLHRQAEFIPWNQFLGSINV